MSKVKVYKPIAFNRLTQAERDQMGKDIYVLPSKALEEDVTTMELEEYQSKKAKLQQEMQKNKAEWYINNGLKVVNHV